MLLLRPQKTARREAMQKRPSNDGPKGDWEFDTCQRAGRIARTDRASARALSRSAERAFSDQLRGCEKCSENTPSGSSDDLNNGNDFTALKPAAEATARCEANRS